MRPPSLQPGVGATQAGLISMPAADVAIVNALRLPDRYAITPEPAHDIDAFLRQFGRTLAGGIRLIQLRAKMLHRDVVADVLEGADDALRRRLRDRVLARPAAEDDRDAAAHGVVVVVPGVVAAPLPFPFPFPLPPPPTIVTRLAGTTLEPLGM